MATEHRVYQGALLTTGIGSGTSDHRVYQGALLTAALEITTPEHRVYQGALLSVVRVPGRRTQARSNFNG